MVGPVGPSGFRYIEGMRGGNLVAASVVWAMTATCGSGCDRNANHRGRGSTSTSGTPAPPAPPADWRTVSHPTYPIRARIPPDWSATTGRNDIIPVDTWELARPGEGGPHVRLQIGWLPRGGRQSSGFPGGLSGMERKVQLVFAGEEITATQEGTWIRGDRDTKHIALGVHGSVGDGGDEQVLRQIIANIEVDDRVGPPPADARLRRAMDAAIAYANERHLDAPDAVLVSDRDRPKTALFTIFYRRGLLSVEVDLETNAVTEKKDR